MTAGRALTAAQVVAVGLGIDEAFVPHAAVTIASAAASTRRPLHFLLLHTGLSTVDRQLVERSAPTARFDWIAVDDPRVLTLPAHRHIPTSACYFRLMLARVAPSSMHRIIYLDSDTVVTADISELFDMDLAGAPLGAVCEADGDHFRYARTMGLDPAQAGCFNSGVLLIDLETVRRDGSFERALDLSLTNKLPCGDQDALNIVFWGRWKSLPLRWNVQRAMTLPGKRMPDMARRSIPTDRSLRPAIVHFTGPEKPWLRDAYHRFAWVYWRHLAATPFLRRVWAKSGIGWAQLVKMFARYVLHWPFVHPETVPPPARQVPLDRTSSVVELAG